VNKSTGTREKIILARQKGGKFDFRVPRIHLRENQQEKQSLSLENQQRIRRSAEVAVRKVFEWRRQICS